MSSNMVKFSMLLCLLFPMVGQADPGDGIAACGVPVCSVTDTMTSLRGMTADQRGMYAINLKNKYKDASDVKVLENLYNTGMELKSLFAELKDEDWVQRAASDLINQVVFNLAKYSKVNGAKLASYYKLFVNQTFRYNLITYWNSQVNFIEDSSTLEQLIIFADAARTHSVAVGDEDWVSRAASSMISEITVKLTNLNPAHEGLYNVRMSEASMALGTLAFDKIAILDSTSNKNLVVAFINSKLRVTVYSFSNAEMNGNLITGKNLSTADSSTRFTFKFDRMTGAVEGTVESTKFDHIDFSGNQIFSTKSVFAGEVAQTVTTADILGTMKGEMAGVQGKLSIRSFQENVYSAAFVSDNGSVIINFQGKFFPKKGVISLTSSDKIKLTLSLRSTDEGKMWMGASFSTTTGTSTTASFAPLH